MLVAKSVWVFFGGCSSEREVSLKSGVQIEASLKRSGFETKLFDVSPGNSLSMLPWASPPDIVFLGLHGTFGEDGVVQGYLESLKVPYVGSGVFSSALCFDKIATKLALVNAGLPCSPSFHIYAQEDLDVLLSNPGNVEQLKTKKYYIKASRQGSTLGSYRFDPKEHADPIAGLRQLCAKAFEYDNRILIEEWMLGRELTVAIFKGKALPIVEIRPDGNFYDYEHKYTKGKTQYIAPAELDSSVEKAIRSAAERAYVVLENRDYARADFILCENGNFVILEMNTLPGMTETSLAPKAAKAANLDYDQFLKELIMNAEARFRS